MLLLATFLRGMFFLFLVSCALHPTVFKAASITCIGNLIISYLFWVLGDIPSLYHPFPFHSFLFFLQSEGIFYHFSLMLVNWGHLKLTSSTTMPILIIRCHQPLLNLSLPKYEQETYGGDQKKMITAPKNTLHPWVPVGGQTAVFPSHWKHILHV